MGWWQVSADTLARSRFVISPLAETTASLLALERGAAAHPGERRWLDAHQAAYRGHVKDHPDIPRLIRLSLARCWIPAVITVAPAGLDQQAFGDELAQIASLSPDFVAGDLEDPRLRLLIDELSAASDRFRELWARADVGYRTGVLHMRHPVVGDLYLRRTRFSVPDSDAQLFIYHPEPGSDSAKALGALGPS